MLYSKRFGYLIKIANNNKKAFPSPLFSLKVGKLRVTWKKPLYAIGFDTAYRGFLYPDLSACFLFSRLFFSGRCFLRSRSFLYKVCNAIIHQNIVPGD